MEVTDCITVNMNCPTCKHIIKIEKPKAGTEFIRPWCGYCNMTFVVVLRWIFEVVEKYESADRDKGKEC